MGEAGVENDPELADLVAKVVERANPVQVWLFGSRADGRARLESDYDVMIVVDDDYPSGRANTLEAWGMVSDLPIPVDATMVRAGIFHERRKEVGSLSYQVARQGKLIYERARSH